MKYSFEIEEIKRCADCPFYELDQFGADGCRLLNDYLNIDVWNKIDLRCTLKNK